MADEPSVYGLYNLKPKEVSTGLAYKDANMLKGVSQTGMPVRQSRLEDMFTFNNPNNIQTIDYRAPTIDIGAAPVGPMTTAPQLLNTSGNYNLNSAIPSTGLASTYAPSARGVNLYASPSVGENPFLFNQDTGAMISPYSTPVLDNVTAPAGMSDRFTQSSNVASKVGVPTPENNFDWRGASELGLGALNLGLALSQYEQARQANQEAITASKMNRDLAQKQYEDRQNFKKGLAASFA